MSETLFDFWVKLNVSTLFTGVDPREGPILEKAKKYVESLRDEDGVYLITTLAGHGAAVKSCVRGTPWYTHEGRSLDVGFQLERCCFRVEDYDTKDQAREALTRSLHCEMPVRIGWQYVTVCGFEIGES